MARLPGGSGPLRGPDAHSVQQQFYQLRADVMRLRAQIGAGVSVEVGGVYLFAGASPPTGTLFCDGSAVNRAAYPLLWQALGTTWGTGDGLTTFNLPDLRGRVPVGAGQGVGLTNRAVAASGGEESHQLTVPELPAHNHGLSALTTGSTGSGGTLRLNTDTGHASVTQTTDNTGSGTAHNIMQPYAVLNYVIRAA